MKIPVLTRRRSLAAAAEELRQAQRCLAELEPTAERWRESLALRHVENALARLGAEERAERRCLFQAHRAIEEARYE